MQSQSLFSRGHGFALTYAALTFILSLTALPSLAHEAPCPYCTMTVTQDTATQDNEVALKIGRKRIEYKCVYCALADAKTAYQGDLTILAPSEKKDAPVKLQRASGKWSVVAAADAPAAAFVLVQPLQHKVCDQRARAFTSTEAAQKYLDDNKATLGDAKPLSLTALVALVDAPK